DELEAHRSFVQLDFVIFGQSIDQVGGGNRFADSILPASRFDQIIKQQRNDVIRLEKSAILVDDPEAIGIAVGGDSNLSLLLSHLFAKSFEQMIVGLGSVIAK